MSNRRDKTPRIRTDDLGHSVWDDTIETGDFELVSTQELRAVLASSDAAAVRSIEQVAADEQDGIVARDMTTGLYRVLDENELQALMASDRLRQSERQHTEADVEPPVSAGCGEEWSLVSTQALRKMVDGSPEAGKDEDDPIPDLDAGGGFDPYNSS